jgi:hypothetical protein
MSDVLTDIFTDEIVGRLRKYATNSPSAEFRCRVFSLQHMPINFQNSAGYEQQLYETRKRWSRWIARAISAGMFEEPHGTELKSRLTGTDSDGFRSALAECMTCWALSSELGLRVLPRPSGQGRCMLEFAVQTRQGEISFEVKSPRSHGSTHPGAESEDSAMALSTYSAAVAMRGALRSANRQFARARRNILVIAWPEIVNPADVLLGERWRASLIRAFYGEDRVTTPASGPSANQFVAEGDFLKRPGGVPRFTRISAVIGLKDLCDHAGLQAVVLHNPCSQNPVDPSIFGEWRQFGAAEGEIRCFRLPNPPPTRAIISDAV